MAANLAPQDISHPAAARFPKTHAPRTSDRPIWDAIFGMYAFPTVLLAHKLKLFALLAAEPSDTEQVCSGLKIGRRPAQALLSVLASLGFLELIDGKYHLTTVSEEYMLEDSPTYFGDYLDLTISNSYIFSLERIERALLTDLQQVYDGGREMFVVHEEQEKLARFFTRSMHAASIGPSLSWPKLIDLSTCKRMLDIGGGSGAHCIGAVQTWPTLRATVYDTKPVCEVAREYISSYGAAERVDTHVGDMWKDPLPRADVHFYSMIHHDWPPEKARFLTQKSFDALPSGGRIIIHDMLFNDDKTGPFAASAFSLVMLLWTEGQQFSGRELTTMLEQIGFRDTQVKQAFGHWGIVTGVKP